MSLRPGGSSSSREGTRKKSYKTAVDAEFARKRREDSLVNIRKNKRHDNLLKKRMESSSSDNIDDHSDGINIDSSLLKAFAEMMEAVPVMVQKICSEDPALQLEAAAHFTKLLSKPIGSRIPIDEVMKAGIVPRFVAFLGRFDVPELQLYASRVLSNVASGTSEHKRVVIEQGTIPLLVQLLIQSDIEEIRAEAILALGNIARGSSLGRDIVLSQGALIPLLTRLNSKSKLSTLRNAAWTISYLARGQPPPPFDLLKPAMPILRELINLDDIEVLSDTCWTICFLSDGSTQGLQALIEIQVFPRVVELLRHQSPSIILAALVTVGTFAASDHNQTQYVIDNGALPAICQLMENSTDKNIRKEACWAISNIIAGAETQIQAVIQANIIPPLVNLLQHGEFDVKKEASYAIFNATIGGSPEQIRFLATKGGIIKPLCDLLVCSDPTVLAACLEGLDSVLHVGEAQKISGLNSGINIYAQMVDEYGGLDKIENLQNHDNNDIAELAERMVNEFWAKDEMEAEEEEQEQEHNNLPQGGFNFG